MNIHLSSKRRKACNACVRAKRRCDLRLPQCSRCASRGSICGYATASEIDSRSLQQAGNGWHRVSPLEGGPIVQGFISIPLSTGTDFNPGALMARDLSPLTSFCFQERTTLTPEQTDFCISQFQFWILQLAQQNQSPFIHSSSYQQKPPEAYQGLLGVCAMYSQKTPQNQSIIFSMLDSQVFRLIYKAKSEYWGAEEYLLGVQAMIMYQIIRLFDGDIRQRANAERHFAMLETWTRKLHSAKNASSNDCGTGSHYRRWIFIESIRRTVIMAIMVQAIYTVVKDGFCTSVPLLATLPVSADGGLWNLSEDIWRQSKPGFQNDMFSYQDFIEKWNGGEALHLDSYETILLAACKHHIRPPLLA
ncbi:hypothetical protein B0O99DRAFT_110933 [Bisporella sp. PMI_857]|nr:hypothetical protein B0O99DRAFT_110933 [Bisporella sp. PMI_857]